MAFLQIALCEEGLPREGDEGECQLRGVPLLFSPVDHTSGRVQAGSLRCPTAYPMTPSPGFSSQFIPAGTVSSLDGELNEAETGPCSQLAFGTLFGT